VPDRRARRTLAVVLVGLGALALIVLVALFVPLGRSGPDTMTVGGHPLVGDPAPEIALETLDGDPVTLSALRGRPVLVNFWATWCLPCRDEFPLLASAYAEHADEGLEILGVVHDDTAEGARAFARDMGATWPLLLDSDDVAWADYLGVAMPTSFFIDADGVVQAASLGAFSEDGLTALLDRILPTG
jgi:cytochrome c biogenesis protein CcmG/thiol:disulfide interchange protein DsbE